MAITTDTFQIPKVFGENHFTDWSQLLDKPAGKYGSVRTKSDQLVFENGKEVRFLGVNLVGKDCFVEKNKAEKLATRLAKMGCNLVRFHHMDAPWTEPNIFDNEPSTLVLSDKNLEKLDYLFHCLKKQGIYSFFDLLVHRKFERLEGFEEGEVMRGGQQGAFFDPDLIELQKEYACQLLSHKNKFTDLSYATDPAVAGCMIINEASILSSTTGDQLSSYQLELLNQQLKEKDIKKISSPLFTVDYSVPGGKLIPNGVTTPEQSKFLLEKEKDYFKQMKSFLQLEVGFKGIVIGSNFPLPMLTSLDNNMAMDAIAVNAYWDHPRLDQVGNNWSNVKDAPIHNQSQLGRKDYFFNNLVQLVSRFKVKGKPLLVTEWNACNPNQFMAEALPFFISYASLQGWNMICQYSFENFNERQSNFSSFNIAHRPDLMALWCLVAPLYSLGMVKEAKQTKTFHFTRSDAQAFTFNDTIDHHPLLPFSKKVELELEIEESKREDVKGSSFIPEETQLVSDFEHGIFQLRTDHAIGLSGFWSGKRYDFPLFQLEVETEYSNVFIVSKDHRPLSEANRLLLLVVGKVEERGDSYDAEKVIGKVIFKHEMQTTSILVTPVYTHREKTCHFLPLILEEDGMCLQLHQQVYDQGYDRPEHSFVYEVEIKRS